MLSRIVRTNFGLYDRLRRSIDRSSESVRHAQEEDEGDEEYRGTLHCSWRCANDFSFSRDEHVTTSTLHSRHHETSAVQRGRGIIMPVVSPLALLRPWIMEDDEHSTFMANMRAISRKNTTLLVIIFILDSHITWSLDRSVRRPLWCCRSCSLWRWCLSSASFVSCCMLKTPKHIGKSASTIFEVTLTPHNTTMWTRGRINQKTWDIYSHHPWVFDNHLTRTSIFTDVTNNDS